MFASCNSLYEDDSVESVVEDDEEVEWKVAEWRNSDNYMAEVQNMELSRIK